MSSPLVRSAAEILHASAVAFEDRGLLILGASGSGKSSLALQLIALGATLVADDRVEVVAEAEGGLVLSAPAPIRGRIEARGAGLLALPSAPARAFAAVDLDRTETVRLPEPNDIVIAGKTLPVFARLEGSAFAPILFLYLKFGSLER